MATYTAINARTLANVIATSNSQEQKWAAKLAVETRAKNPFKMLIGGYKGGKPIVEVMDTRKLRGDTINLGSIAPLGGEGVQGDTELVGNEEKGRHNMWQFKIGEKRHATAATELARSQTVPGAMFSETSDTQLTEWLANQQGWDVEKEMMARASALNTLYANSRLSLDTLGTGDFLQGADIVGANMAVSTLQGKPITTGKSSSGSDIKKYLLVATDRGLERWKGTSQYQNILAQAGTRGAENNLFGGGLPDWFGNLIWEWQQELGTQYGKVASASLGMALLGEAIAANTTAPTLKGGGDATGAALTAPKYFHGFQGAQYVGFEGEKIAVDTTRRYWCVMNVSGADRGKFGFYSGTSNTGNTLVADERLRASASGGAVTTLTGSTITWASSTFPAAQLTDAHPIGSIVFEVNAKGTPFCRNWLIGREALVCGYGAIDDKLAIATPIKEVQDFGSKVAYGLKCVWGVKAVPRTDGLVNGYAQIISAWAPPGYFTVA